MQLIIDIPEKIYNYIKRLEWTEMEKKEQEHLPIAVVCKAVKEGIPLPKGHGRILDEKDILDTENNDGGWYDLVDMPEYIAGVKAIIEADKEQ